MNNRYSFPGNTPVHLLTIVLALSPVVRFSWDLWSQTLLHVLMTAALVLFLVSRSPGFRFLPHGLFILFFAGASLSLWNNPDPASIRGSLLVLLDALIAGCLFSVLPAEQRRKLLLIPVLAGFFFSVILLFFALTSYNGGYLEPDAIVNRNVIAGYLVLAFPLSFVLWDAHGRPGWAVSAVLFTGLLLTHSRAAIFFSTAAAGVFLWQRGGPSRRLLAVAAPLALAAFAYAAVMKFGQDSLGSRLLWWKSAAQIFFANPVNGAGWGNFGSLFPMYKAGEGLNTLYAHNIFLQALADGGILAFIPFCALLCGLFFARRRMEASPDRSFGRALYLSAGSFLAVNLLDYSFFIPAVMLLFFAVMGAAADGVSVERERIRVPAWGTLGIIAALAFVFLVPLQANRYYRHGLYFLKKNDPARAEDALRKALSLDPLPFQYYSAAAETAFMRYSRSNDRTELQAAIVRQRQAIERFPAGGKLWADLAWLHLCAGDRNAAVEAMRTAADRDRTTQRYRQALASFEPSETPRHGK